MKVNSPADPPVRRFFHDGTEYQVRGDETLAMSHFAEVRSHLHQLKRTNVNQLPILTGSKIFDDGTTADYSLIHGRENIEVFAPLYTTSGEESAEQRFMKAENLVPCFIVTGADDQEIIGYIASMGGTFTGPYQWFDWPKSDGLAVLEAFYNEGQYDYIPELAFKSYRKLAENNHVTKKILYFFKPSGIAPNDDRISQGPDIGAITETETCGPVSVLSTSGDNWVSAIPMSTNAIGGGGTYGYDLLFDGEPITREYEETAYFSGWYLIKRDSGWLCIDANIPPNLDQCLADLAAYQDWVAAYDWPSTCQSDPTNTNSFDHTQTFDDATETILDDYPNGSIRLNSGIAYSVYLLETWDRHSSSHTWNYRPAPSYTYNQWGTSPCAGCYDLQYYWSNELFVVINNGDRQSITANFSWSDMAKYEGVYGAGIVYHNNMSTPSTSLATVFYGPTDIDGNGDYTEMGCIYVGPAAEGLEGSVNFPLINEEYSVIPDVIDAPIDIDWRVRGQIFLGIVEEIKELK